MTRLQIIRALKKDLADRESGKTLNREMARLKRDNENDIKRLKKDIKELEKMN